MDGMAILIGNPNGSAIVPMLEREGLKVEITHSPEQALERLQAIVGVPPEGQGVPTEGGNGGAIKFSDEPFHAPYGGQEGVEGGGALDRRLAAVQERARMLESEEQKIITEALQTAGGNKTAAARLLGISRYALQRRLRRFAKPQQQNNPIS